MIPTAEEVKAEMFGDTHPPVTTKWWWAAIRPGEPKQVQP
jgi:hypothetical protein